MSPDSSPTGFSFVFQYGDEKTGAEWQGSSGKGGRCSIFKIEEYFYYHRASNDRNVLSQSAGIGHSGGEVLPYKRLLGMRRWMGSYFHLWIGYNGVAFSLEFY